MREIKYRFWDEITKSMSADYSMDEILDGNLFHFRSWIPLQYTGVKDCNGSEIYEGDIISDWQGIRDVTFQIFDDTQGYFIEMDDSNLIIIGNRFEHLELLTQPEKQD